MVCRKPLNVYLLEHTDTNKSTSECIPRTRIPGNLRFLKPPKNPGNRRALRGEVVRYANPVGILGTAMLPIRVKFPYVCSHCERVKCDAVTAIQRASTIDIDRQIKMSTPGLAVDSAESTKTTCGHQLGVDGLCY
eukprot:3968309-Pyramimonas_sp.AAC.1